MNFLGSSFCGSSSYVPTVVKTQPTPVAATTTTTTTTTTAAVAPAKPASVTAKQLAKKITHSTERKAFELAINETQSAWIDYAVVPTPNGSVLNLIRTEVPLSHAGQGIGGALIQYAFEYAWEQRMKVRASCPSVSSWLLKNPDFQSQLEHIIPENF